jgi:hypothetical protein
MEINSGGCGHIDETETRIAGGRRSCEGAKRQR